MNPEHHRQLAVAFGIGRRIDVQVEAILALSRVRKSHVVVNVPLKAMPSKFGGIPHALPLGQRHWRLPAQIAHRRRRIGQPQERLHLAVVDGLAGNFALFGLYLQRIGIDS